MSKLRRTLNRAGAFVLLGFVGYTIWPFLAGPGQMKTFCNTLTIGASLDDVQREVAQHGYQLRIDGNGSAPIFDSRSMARFICHVEFSQGRLTAARYVYND